MDGEQIARVRRRLLRWGRANFRQYAWRSEQDPWLTLVAEFFLQRTRASQVETPYERFREMYPTASSLVEAGAAAAQAAMARLGLNFRGSQLHTLATEVTRLGGRPPEAEDELRRFTGVGPYTSAAWLSLHRDRRAVIVDSNVARWLARLTARTYHRDPRGVRWVNTLADRLTPRRAFRDYNYAVLDFTMQVCTQRVPRCLACPLRPDCAYGGDVITPKRP